MLTPEQRAQLRVSMMEKLPDFDPKWSNKVIEMWFALFEKMWAIKEANNANPTND